MIHPSPRMHIQLYIPQDLDYPSKTRLWLEVTGGRTLGEARKSEREEVGGGMNHERL